MDPKLVLKHYLDGARDALLWKLEGLSDYDVRRPLTPTGTNLLGIVKHLAAVELGYFGETFGRPSDDEVTGSIAESEPNADMWATPDETRAEIVHRYERARAHADATIDALDLDATGSVPWWGTEVNPVTLHLVLVHMIAETHRHAGHADIVRELIDGAVGLRPESPNLPDVGEDDWPDFVDRLEAAATEAQQQLDGVGDTSPMPISPRPPGGHRGRGR